MKRHYLVPVLLGLVFSTAALAGPGQSRTRHAPPPTPHVVAAHVVHAAPRVVVRQHPGASRRHATARRYLPPPLPLPYYYGDGIGRISITLNLPR